MNFASPMQCDKKNSDNIELVLILEDRSLDLIKNGTILEFQLGHLFNPISLAYSDSFQLSTYIVTRSQFSNHRSYLNKQSQNLQIKNHILGALTVNSITQYGNDTYELGQETKILLNITTANPIPSGALLSMIFPTNLEMSGTLRLRVNGWPIDKAQMNAEAHTIACYLYQEGQTNFLILIESGLRNPSVGPYSYTSFNIEFMTGQGWGIDQSITTETQILTHCFDNCQSCEGSLSNCQKCGTNTTTNIAYNLYEQKCYEKCPSGLFGSSGYECLPCELPCVECQFASDLCTICDPLSEAPYSNLVTLSCTSECPSGTYPDEATKQCLACKAPCYTCLSANECLTCDLADPDNTEIFFFNDTCVSECPSVSIASPSKVCVNCEAPCYECAELPDKCTSCGDGLYLYKSLCVEKCPWQTYRDSDVMECKGVASLDIPMPFSVTIIIVSIGVGISGCMKHSGLGSTNFLAMMLPICDIFLRVNWFVLGVLALADNLFITFYGCCGLLTIGLAVNVLLWRRFFKFKYNMDENDRAFTTYCMNYPKTSSMVMLMSYLISFQAIRLSYSRFLGKKMFMASFTRQKRYYRLIGQLSLIEVFAMFIPALALETYSFWFELLPGQQLFYIAVDSLFLVFYATVLITVTLTQREKVLRPRELFQWREICRFNVHSDEEAMYDTEDDSLRAPGSRERRKRVTSQHDALLRIKGQDLLDASEIVQEIEPENLDVAILDTSSAHSEQNYVQLKRRKLKHLYKLEHRSRNPQPVPQTDISDIQDFSEFQNLEEKISRIRLKAELYENNRDSDYNRFKQISTQISTQNQEAQELETYIKQLKESLLDIKREISKELQEQDEIDVAQVIQQPKRNPRKQQVSLLPKERSPDMNSSLDSQPHLQSYHQAFTLQDRNNETNVNNLFNFGKPMQFESDLQSEVKVNSSFDKDNFNSELQRKALKNMSSDGQSCDELATEPPMTDQKDRGARQTTFGNNYDFDF